MDKRIESASSEQQEGTNAGQGYNKRDIRRYEERREVLLVVPIEQVDDHKPSHNPDDDAESS